MTRQRVYTGFFRVEKVQIPARTRPREVVLATDSVCLLLYDKVNRRIILVRQPREAMIRDDNPDGQITELTAGRFDVDLDAVSLMVKEAAEEVGVTLRPEQIELINNGQPMAVSAGMATERSILGYAVITPEQIGPDQQVFGADNEEELIQRIFIIAEAELENYICEDIRVFAMIQWLLRRLERENRETEE